MVGISAQWVDDLVQSTPTLRGTRGNDLHSHDLHDHLLFKTEGW